jgi:deoxyribodipyrimidine photolyase-related protein
MSDIVANDVSEANPMPSKIKTLRLILGDQLNMQHPWFQQPDGDVLYLIAEMHQESAYVTHHIQKIVGFFSAMRAFARELAALGHQVHYIKITDEDAKLSLTEILHKSILQNGVEKFEYQLPDEYRLDEQLKTFSQSAPVKSQVYDTYHFLSERMELRKMFPGSKTPLMETFYRSMRKRYEVLMDPSGKPEGGKWNYDAENRQRYNGKEKLPDYPMVVTDCSDVFNDISQAGLPCIGNIDAQSFSWPINRQQSIDLLHHFCDNVLHLFGKYQDAMHTDDWLLFHSRLSFAMNIKLISPMEVIDAAVTSYHNSNGKITLPQVEGFVRQILGWREYMRGIYWGWMPGFGTLNYLNHHRKLPSWFWTGDTKMNCLKHAIRQSLDKAYAHHIQRLMVTGNFALLAGINPDDVDQWYLGIYIDAIEWVEITNTRGMSQFADGGIVGTKPYVSSANYIGKMSNYCKSCHYDADLKSGAGSCPFNSLYWNFYELYRSKFEKNPRIGMMYRILDKMPGEQRAALLEQADHYLQNIDSL